MPKHSKKHEVRFYRGNPVLPKAARRKTRGAPRKYPADENTQTMVRSTKIEQEAWHLAARAEARELGLTDDKLTIGPWLRRLANADAKAKGFLR